MMKNTDAEKNRYSIKSDTESQNLLSLSTELLAASGVQRSEVMLHTRQMLDTAVKYKELRMMYTCAMKEVKTKLDVLNTEFSTLYQRNPIKFINTRLKSTSSIGEKLDRQGIPFSLENVETHLHDVAGIRVICSYVDDIYMLAQMLTGQDDIELIRQKDYIANPKPNGYRSLHLIVRVPVFFANQTKRVMVEVQIRTIAMDFWASLEHQLKYKRDINDEKSIVAQLKECADVIAHTDEKMLNIRKHIENMTPEQTEEEILLEKLSRLDVPIE